MATKVKTETPVTGYKGLDKNFQCRDHQFEVGGEYEHKGPVKLCERGFHFVENPLDIFGYYPPNDARFAEVEGSEVSDESGDDSKRVCKRLRIKAEISLPALLGLGVKFILDKIDFKNAKESNTGYQSAATNTGYQSAATNTGYQSAATNTGDQSAATNTGYQGCAVSLGIEGRAKGAIGCWLTLAEWKEIENSWQRIDVQTIKVDGEHIKPDTFYILKDGKFSGIE
jgi:hypothetical protein